MARKASATQIRTLWTAEDLARAAPAGLARYVLPRWRTERYHRVLSEKLVDIATGRITRLIVTMPPRHGKSTLCSHMFPAWYLGTYPDRRVILTSYEANYAATWGRKARDVLESVGPHVFGVRVAPSSSAASAWEVERVNRQGRVLLRGGGMQTAGVGGPITGKGAHVLLIDDPIKNADEACSALRRQGQKDWYQSTAYTRLEADPEGAIVLIMTRWHEDDLVGWQLAECLDDDGEAWEVVNFPAIAEGPDVLGRVAGQALSTRYPIERLERIKRRLGSYWFQALYQQTPSPSEGTIFKQSWLRYGVGPVSCDSILQVWDTAFKTGELNDYAACITVGFVKTTHTAYVLHVLREKLEMPALLKAMQAQAERWKPNLILIEDKGSGTSAVQTLRSQTRLPVQAQPVRGDKVSRAHLVTPHVEAGRVVLCSFPLLHDFEDELFRFPLGMHDDMVDVFVYAVQRLFGGSHREARQHAG